MSDYYHNIEEDICLGIVKTDRVLKHIRHQADRIEELDKACKEWAEVSQRNYQRAKAAEAKLATCEKYRDAYAECDRIGTQAVRDLEGKLNKAIDALEKVQAFVRDLEPYADQGHTLVPALREACEILAELKGEDRG